MLMLAGGSDGAHGVSKCRMGKLRGGSAPRVGSAQGVFDVDCAGQLAFDVVQHADEEHQMQLELEGEQARLERQRQPQAVAVHC